MAVQNAIGDSFRGATWVALHNGGGVGWLVEITCLIKSERRTFGSFKLIQQLRRCSTDNCHLLYIELTISFLIGRKRTVNFRNQRL